MIAILTTGDWGIGQVNVRWTGDSRARHREVEQYIDAAWEAAFAQPGIKLFDGPMCRLESWRADCASLDLVLSPTSYKAFFGTNLTHPELAGKFGANVLANPVGLSAALVTADGFLMLGRRNASVAYYPNRIHPFAGCLEPGDGGDLFGAIRRELAEELGFADADVSEIRCCGMVEDPALHQPEVMFRVRSRRTRREVQEHVDAGEHSGSWSIPASREGIKEGVKNTDLTPVGVGALLLWGMSQFGGDFLKGFGADILRSGVKTQSA